ncbi:LOW QUALITY PROTEIN: hypothetical protein PHMEG_00010457, partial [Phytophthora megakarya]
MSRMGCYGADNVYPLVLLDYTEELGCALEGALLWTITQPLHSVARRFSTAASMFVDKWMETSLLYIVVSPKQTSVGSILDHITPLGGLEARGEHEEGVGRLLYKWLEAYHAFWCVFLPDLVEYSWTSARKYRNGIHIELWRSSSRAWCACIWAWMLSYVLVFGHLYLTICSYDLVEWLCMGWPSVTVLFVV